LMPAHYVKVYVKRGKNDVADAEAICEAVARPTMRFVAIKSREQQAVLVMHRTPRRAGSPTHPGDQRSARAPGRVQHSRATGHALWRQRTAALPWWWSGNDGCHVRTTRVLVSATGPGSEIRFRARCGHPLPVARSRRGARSGTTYRLRAKRLQIRCGLTTPHKKEIVLLCRRKQNAADRMDAPV